MIAKEFVVVKLKGFPGSALNRIDLIAVHFFTVAINVVTVHFIRYVHM